MPELAIDYPSIAELTESGSVALRNRLARRFEIADSVEQTDAEGGAAAIVRRTVLLNQLDRSMPWDGRFDNYLNNCGPSCCSMIVHHVTGRRIWPDEIVDWMRGEDHEGYTSVTDQVNFLNAHGVPSRAIQASSLSEFRSMLQDQVNNGRLSIVLVFFDWSANTGGHFEVVYLADEPGVDVGCLNPWKGTYVKTTWENLWANTKNGWLVLAQVSGKDKGESAFTVLRENRYAETRTEVNVRTGPSTRYSVVKVVPPGARLYFSKYTDEGQRVVGSNPETRWHYSEEAGGWLFDGGLHEWEAVPARAAAPQFPGVRAENRMATTRTDVNARRGPGTEYEVIKAVPAGTQLRFTKVTDKGQRVSGSGEHETRWHFAPDTGGWMYDGGLHNWKDL